ncbi:nuclear receptor 2C2-associated protein [Copidosoma floridanum]|uniref:nuclear receptor 2C2-associated protein n=1 Tax=Copidosoma floridanum TaxID=29053 RepID=UPI0006C95E0D|nr:nuclear receptor 2C2-associated protein [Copidosoma floridanum]
MTNSFTLLVSSVLNKNVKSYGKQFMFDSDCETCWNSDSGSPQWVLVSFPEEVCLSLVQIQFQGGFAGLKCYLEAGPDTKDLGHVENIYPEDINSIQEFKLSSPVKSKVFKIVFETSTDFFGRIVIYQLSLFS